jgi:general secretion pathway protein K
MIRPVPEGERGAALLAVLLLVAILGGLAASALERLKLSTALAANTTALDQARAYAIGIESLLTLRVEDLVRANSEVTTLAGNWHGPVRTIPLPGGGVAQGAVTDAGNCFNLNGLVAADDQGRLTANPSAINQLAALLAILGAPEHEARAIAEAAADWADADASASRSGAEDPTYAAAARPYRAANTLFAEVSELRAVSGVTPEAYARARPYLCALPFADVSPLNVNTLGEKQAPLLAMLAPGAITLETARAAIAQRPPNGWRNVADFWRTPALARVPPPGEAMSQVQLKTQWFAIDLNVTFAGAEVTETALVDARRERARLVLRRWGPDE